MSTNTTKTESQTESARTAREGEKEEVVAKEINIGEDDDDEGEDEFEKVMGQIKCKVEFDNMERCMDEHKRNWHECQSFVKVLHECVKAVQERGEGFA